MKGLSLNKKQKIQLLDTDDSMVIIRGKGGGGRYKGIMGLNGEGRSFSGEHTLQCIDDAL